MKRILTKGVGSGSCPPTLSVVAPVFNESENLKHFRSRLGGVLERLGVSYEIIFVDDGSRDDSAEVACRLHEEDDRVKLVRFSRNFGHQTAITAGLDFARGDAVVIMDSDLQHPPEVIPALFEKWSEGFEAIFTVRESTADATFLKRLSSSLFYKLLRILTGTQIPAHSSDFRLLDRKVVDAMKRVRERSRFMRGLFSWVGFESTSVEYKADARFAGVSSYTLRRMIRLAMDGVTSFSSIPLYVSFHLGVLQCGLGCLYAAYILYARLVAHTVVPGWSSVALLVTITGGIQFCMIGLLGLYVGRIFEEVKQRPLYLIADAIGFSGRDEMDDAERSMLASYRAEGL